jgi:glutathione synthase/RimK-type ligase-like ATP-grasp enzyme
MILISAQHFHLDNHINSVCYWLEKWSQDYFFFERYRNDHLLSFQFNNDAVKNCFIENEKKILDISKIKSVFWRIKPVISAELPYGDTDIEETFCKNQWLNTLRAFSTLCQEAVWVNPIKNSIFAENKIIQLTLAQQCCLSIPATLFSNNPEKIINFLKGCKRTIYKTVSPFITENSAIYTNEININEIRNNSNAIKMAPSIYQEYIDKSYELRVTVVNDSVFTLKVNAQNDIDWRHDQLKGIFLPDKLSESTKTKLLKLQNKLGLVYGAYDFIVNKEGQEIFLECNPNGQWYFHEEIGMQISQAIAKTLI